MPQTFQISRMNPMHKRPKKPWIERVGLKWACHGQESENGEGTFGVGCLCFLSYRTDTTTENDLMMVLLLPLSGQTLSHASPDGLLVVRRRQHRHHRHHR